MKLQLLTFINGIPPFVLVSVLIALILLLFRKQLFTARIPARGQWKDEAWPFYVKQLLSQPEQILFHRLVKALPEHIILAQVQVSQVLGVHKGFNFYEWNNRINRLSYDFVVCNKDGSVHAVIELDDKSHESKERVEADKRKDRATSAAGIRMVRWHARSMPDENAIKDELMSIPDRLIAKEGFEKFEPTLKK